MGGSFNEEGEASHSLGLCGKKARPGGPSRLERQRLLTLINDAIEKINKGPLTNTRGMLLYYMPGQGILWAVNPS